MNKYKRTIQVLLILSCIAAMPSLSQAESLDAPFHEWSQEFSLNILNESPWAQHLTYIRQLRGVGSGIQGEKEVYNTYFVRFLSAKPVRKAFSRLKELHVNYENLSESQKIDFETENRKAVELELDDWIVVSVAFRSNVPREESSVDQFLMSQTTETIKTRAYLSTKRFPRLEISEYIPPNEKIVGAKFIFPRSKDGVEIVTAEDERIVFEFDAPGNTSLRTTFNVEDMLQGGDLVL